VEHVGDAFSRRLVGPCATGAEAVALWKKEMGIISTPYQVHAGVAPAAPAPVIH
jgi:hypothetical protein